jgi:hypothetical protein
MTRLVLIVAIAVLSFSAMVVAATSLDKAQPRASTSLPSPHEAAANWEWNQGWPAPQAPFDETPITPVESAGAPMFR